MNGRPLSLFYSGPAINSIDHKMCQNWHHDTTSKLQPDPFTNFNRINTQNLISPSTNQKMFLSWKLGSPPFMLWNKTSSRLEKWEVRLKLETRTIKLCTNWLVETTIITLGAEIRNTPVMMYYEHLEVYTLIRPKSTMRLIARRKLKLYSIKSSA